MVKGLGRSIGTPTSACGAALIIAVLWSAPAAAQQGQQAQQGSLVDRFVTWLPFGGMFSSRPAPAPSSSSTVSRPMPGGQSLLPPPPIPPAPIPSVPASLAPAPSAPTSLTPPQSPAAAVAPPPQSNHVALGLSARYSRDVAQPINGGIVWRIYPAKPSVTGVFRTLREERNPSPMLMLPPGDYIVHASFGLASAAKTVRLRTEPAREVFELPAGGIRIEGRVGDVPIPAGQISFDIFSGSQFEPGDKTPVAQGVMTGDIVVVPEGTYHIVSNYGDSNAVVRSDIRVQVGKLTDITVAHRAAVITLKLVGESGGEALANTNWTVLTPGGDVIKESIGAFPRVVLAEGDYRAIARNEGKTFEREFNVTTGVDGEIELLAR
ncbi:MAG: hypothetical protein WAU59_04460 [Rhodoplanes sp.]